MQVSVVHQPASRTQHQWYLGNRPPLLPTPLTKLPLGSVRAKGWLRHQLDLMVDGMVGRLEEVSAFLRPDGSWLTREGARGMEAYWLRGYQDLAVLTGDERLLANSRKRIEAVFASQREDGYFGPAELVPVGYKYRANDWGLFGHALMLDAIVGYYEHTKDQRVVSFLTRFFEYCRDIPNDKFIPDGTTFDIRRPCEMIEHLHWLYNHTRQQWLLDLAARFFKRFPHTTDPWPGRSAMLGTVENDFMTRFRTDEWLDHHVVDFTHRYRYPGMFYPQSKASWHLAATEYWYLQHMGTWGQQPRGLLGADEVIRSTYTDPRQATETCALVEFGKGFYLLGRITGDPKYADRCEDIMLNHFPASQTPDLKGLHYLTASNQPQLDASENHEYANKLRMLCYSPHDAYCCCQHNVAMGWPWYVQNLWQATSDDGLAAWLYASSEVTARVGRGGKAVTINVDTDYPFGDTVHMRVVTSEPVEFPLYLRVPKWCKGFSVLVNADKVDVEPPPQTYVRIERVWADGDVLDIKMPMQLSLTEWPRNGSVTVDRGPLSYSIRIEEEWKRCGGTDEWPEWEVFPRSPWNYGLVIDRDRPEASLQVVEKDILAKQPWTIEDAALEIRAKARRIPNWKLENETVQELRPSPVKSDEPEETIRMIPLGCARLRMSCLPVIGDSPEAREWT